MRYFPAFLPFRLPLVHCSSNTLSYVLANWRLPVSPLSGPPVDQGPRLLQSSRAVDSQTSSQASSTSLYLFIPLLIISAVPSYQADAVAGYLKALSPTNKGLFNSTGRGFPDIAAQVCLLRIFVLSPFHGIPGRTGSSHLWWQAT